LFKEVSNQNPILTGISTDPLGVNTKNGHTE